MIESIYEISDHAKGELVSYLQPFFTTRKSSSAAGKHLDVLWQGQSPPGSVGPGVAWIIPQLSGSNITFNLTKLTMFFENVGGSQYVVKAQKSTDGGTTWTDIGVCTVPASTQQNVQTLTSKTTGSGDLVRIYWVTLGAGASLFTLQLEGDQQ